MKRFVIAGGFCLAAATGSAFADSPPMTKPAPRVVVIEDEQPMREATIDKKPTPPRVEFVNEVKVMPARMIDNSAPSTRNSHYHLATDDHAPDGVELVGADPVMDGSPPSVTAVAPYMPAARRTTNVWISAEYLRWHISDGPLPVPLVTTGNPLDPIPGGLGQPGTQVLYGGQNIDFGWSNGFRLTAGGWLPGEPFGGEVSFFSLQRRSRTFAIGSDGAGNPPLYLPAINPANGAEVSLVVADPVLLFDGRVAVTSQSRLLGAEANALLAGATCQWGEVDLLAGFRYLDLEESITLQNPTTDLALGTYADLIDRFETENRFYGAQIGARATGYCSKYFASVTGKVAVGWTRSVVDVQGFAYQTSPAPGIPTGTFNSGFYTQASNTGRRDAWDCSVVPEVNVRVGCDLFGCVKAFVGYDWLYWCNVARPGEQIDRSVNLAQSPFLVGVPGPARPAPLHNTTDFFVHGFSVGVELHY